MAPPPAQQTAESRGVGPRRGRGSRVIRRSIQRQATRVRVSRVPVDGARSVPGSVRASRPRAARPAGDAHGREGLHRRARLLVVLPPRRGVAGSQGSVDHCVHAGVGTTGDPSRRRFVLSSDGALDCGAPARGRVGQTTDDRRTEGDRDARPSVRGSNCPGEGADPSLGRLSCFAVRVDPGIPGR